MRLSHSKLCCILDCPMTYYLRYKQGISLKEKKKALTIGSDVHYGLEHAITDLKQHYIEEGTLQNGAGYSREQVLAEVMVKNFLDRKDEIFDKILTDHTTGEKLQLLEEVHELEITGKLKSFTNKEPTDFLGIIDLFLLTNKGIIILDYKTSSGLPNWNDYLDQIYRYIFLAQSEFPEVPIIKIGIINLVKDRLDWKRGEPEDAFRRRLTNLYAEDTDLLNYHEFTPDNLDQEKIDRYITNLAHQADLADAIDKNNIFYINYGSAIGKYGKSDYYDIFYHTPYAYLLYEISDNIYDEDEDKIITTRDCVQIDMLVCEHDNVLNKYEKFKIQALAFYSQTENIDKDKLFVDLRKRFITDETLLERYWTTLLHEIEMQNKLN